MPPAPHRKRRLNRDLLLISVPSALLVIGAFALTLLLMRPAPPGTITLATGAADGTYHAIGVRYRDILARDGVTVRLVPSQGAVDNLKRLSDPASDIDVALVQAGIATRPEDAPGIVSLGTLYYEPLWLFHRGTSRITRLGALRGKMIAVGAANSGTSILATTMLRSNAMDAPPTTLLPISGRAAADLLLSGGIDAAFFMADAQSPLIQELMRAEGIQLMHFARADAYVRQHPFLERLTLPQGVFDLERNIPDQDVTVLGVRAHLMARDTLHPALAYLLLRAASEVHAGASMFAPPRTFPAPGDPELPLSQEASRYYQSGPPFLQRYLPYWAANLVDRLLVLLLPALAVLLPTARLLPAVYRWRVSSRIYRWYARLKEIELELEERRSQEQLRRILERLDAIEDAVNHIETPLAYSENLYVFRQHIDLVRQRTRVRLRRAAPASAATSSDSAVAAASLVPAR
jgi:TRAP transporter TAXI family solute receptor